MRLRVVAPSIVATAWRHYRRIRGGFGVVAADGQTLLLATYEHDGRGSAEVRETVGEAAWARAICPGVQVGPEGLVAAAAGPPPSDQAALDAALAVCRATACGHHLAEWAGQPLEACDLVTRQTCCEEVDVPSPRRWRRLLASGRWPTGCPLKQG